MKLKPHKPNTRWTEKDKDRAVVIYKSLGSPIKTAEISGIPYDTLYLWMKTDWWKEKLQACKAEDTAQLEDAATTIAKKSAEIVHERLTNGDHVFNKDGELVRKPVSARDAAIIGAVAIDKRKILQEEPIREQQLGTSERLLKLVEQFARLTNEKTVRGHVVKMEQDALDAEIIPEDAEQPQLQEKL